MKFNIWKYIYIVLFVAIVPVFSWANPEKRTFTLVIDAGHGGHDAGAVGAFSKEKNINLRVALAFGKLVENNCSDVKVIYTRKTDVFIPLQTRADIANRNKADLFISVHTNALPAGRQAYGSETYTLGMARASANLAVAKRENSVITLESNYQSTYKGFDPNKAESYVIFEFMQDKYMKQSVDLASCIQREYTSAGRPNKGVHQAGFLVLRNTSMPSVLTELGFITTPSEEAYLNSEQGVTELSRSIYNGFLNYRRMHERAANDIPANLPNHVDGTINMQDQATAPISPSNADGVNASTSNDDDVAVVPVAAVPTERLVAQAATSDEPNLRSVRSQAKQPRTNSKPAETTPRRENPAKPQSKAQPKAVEKPSKVEKQEDGNKAKPTPTNSAPARATSTKSTPKDKDIDNKKELTVKKNAPKKEVEKKENPKASPSKASVNAKDKSEAKTASTKDKKNVDAKKSVSSKDKAKDAKETVKKEQDKKKLADKKATTSAKDKDNKTKKDTDKKTSTAKANVTYRIQVGAGKTQIDTKDPQFKGLSVSRVKEGTMNKYFYGTYHSYAEAQKALKTVKGKISSAYIVAYVSGKSVSVAEARNKENTK